ncbi:ADP-ribosylglycohydrolase [Candidatus Moduliflexus flocculans]|uniref:ADP-ribosylglycohydrolase n=1 Tax=Candidatus Moduliflexus flocculans TaxID=1499966 RepID=A0A081BQI4_9BACT|nr:ADP-ribosylglycohydrolase [Candidatus Moduliflexus flocculans]
MIGALAGDIIGSVYERFPLKTTTFPLFHSHCRFTDDSVMTVAVADAILKGADYAASMKRWGRKYPDAGYGGSFFRWIFQDDVHPYHSWGNGSAMRVSPIGWAFATIDDVLREAENTAIVSHDHPEGIKGAQAVALAVFLARTGHTKDAIRQEICLRFNYTLERTVDAVRPTYTFDVSCQGSVPEAIIAFLDSTNYEGAVRNAISLGGDSDTLACIAGAIAEAFYQDISDDLRRTAQTFLPEDMLDVLRAFEQRFSSHGNI